MKVHATFSSALLVPHFDLIASPAPTRPIRCQIDSLPIPGDAEVLRRMWVRALPWLNRVEARYLALKVFGRTLESTPIITREQYLAIDCPHRILAIAVTRDFDPLAQTGEVLWRPVLDLYPHRLTA